MQIRPADARDLGAINAIYNYYVLHSTATYQTEPATAEERAAWFAGHGPLHPVLVAEQTPAGGVVGWASLSPFHPRAAYRQTAETSVYVQHGQQRRGVGRALMEELIRQAETLGYHALIGGVSADQTASVGLHSALGFVEVGRLREVGYKFGRWLDVVYMERLLSGKTD
jgi:phosphinothricin acetyltransferase